MRPVCGGPASPEWLHLRAFRKKCRWRVLQVHCRARLVTPSGHRSRMALGRLSKEEMDMSGAVRQMPATEDSSSKPQTFIAKAYAAHSATTALAPFTVPRRSPRPQDVQIEILYCGVCHSDLHQVRNEWKEVMPTVYPVVPGHEIVGRVTKVGSAVTNFKAGDIAAGGCMVDSCRHCAACKAGEEQYCENFMTLTYNGEDKILGGVTYGGYSTAIVVDEKYVLSVPKGLDPAGAAPLLCAGITTYSPLRHWNVGKGQKVGVVGLGGLGHMGVKFAHAFGAHVVLFTTSPNKTADALRLGADEVVVSKNEAEMRKHANSFNFILDAVSAHHDVNRHSSLLKLMEPRPL